jgi:uncharacterized protein (DUF1015 family)
MTEVIPFRGLLYDQSKVGFLKFVTAPPYDVIQPDLQEELYHRNPYNVIRLILGKEYSEDTPEDNRYTRSAKSFKNWLNDEIFEEDEKPCFYGYSQEYDREGQTVKRIGFFARVKLEEFEKGNIFPHEFTLEKAKKDRSQLIKACRANFSPIFGLFSDPSGSVDAKLKESEDANEIGVVEQPGVVHRVWKIENPDAIKFLTQEFRDKKIYIADGHHRYETALAYNKSQEEGDDSSHVMMFLANLDSDSLSVFPIHRLVKSAKGFDPESFISDLESFFEIETLSPQIPAEEISSHLSDLQKQSKIAFVAYLRRNKFYSLTVKSPEAAVPFFEDDEPADLQILGVTQLHTIAIKKILGVNTRLPENQQNFSYTIDIPNAIENVDAGVGDVAFFLNPTLPSQVKELASKGIRLPQKATYFYPKLLSGLVLNKFR